MRREFPKLVARLAALGTIEDLSLTTNGYLLGRDAVALAEAGLNRINVSIDSLERDRFFRLTRRDSMDQVLEGLEAIMAQPTIGSVKVNAVAIRDFTEEEVPRFCELARTHRLPGALHRVHAARRRPVLGPGPGADRRRAA